jgi:predicted ATPase
MFRVKKQWHNNGKLKLISNSKMERRCVVRVPSFSTIIHNNNLNNNNNTIVVAVGCERWFGPTYHSKNFPKKTYLKQGYQYFSSAPSCNDNDTDNDNDNETSPSTSTAPTPMPTPYVQAHYQTLIESNKVSNDEHQLRALVELDRLRDDIVRSKDRYSVSTTSTNTSSSSSSTRTGTTSIDEETSSFQSVLTNWWETASTSLSAVSSSSSSTTSSISSAFKGVYLHGGVGCGKTFCMDLFYKSLDEYTSISKQKVHFHKFMLDVHSQMHTAQQIHGMRGDAVLNTCISQIIANGKIICLDEFQVTDVANAMILKRLIVGLKQSGAVIVATSNRPPCDLYLNGLQRDLFLPFIDFLVEEHDVVSMWDSEVDYRLVQGELKAKGVYFVQQQDDNDKVNGTITSSSSSAKDDFETTFAQLTKHSVIASTHLITQGRRIPIPHASMEYKVARFTFDDLCRTASGAADYLIIGNHFHTVFVENVPCLNMNDVNLVRRFIVFVDSMYENNVKLVLLAHALPQDLFLVDLDNEFCDEAFAFDRTRSRLEEMGSDAYLRGRWAGGGGGGTTEQRTEKEDS